MRCIGCRSQFDSRISGIASEPEIALAIFEHILLDAISDQAPGRIQREIGCPLRFTLDVAWALMRPLRSTRYRVAHALEGTCFQMPYGFNTPVDVPDWLSRGSIILRRFLLSVTASLHFPDGSRESMALTGRSHREMWTELRAALSAPDAEELRRRAAHWDIAIRDELDFYWLRNRNSTG